MFCLSSSNMQEAEVVSSRIIPLSGQNLHSVPPMHTLWANRLAAASILLIFASKIKPFWVFVGSCPAKNFPAPTAPPFSPVQRLFGRHTARLLGFLFLSLSTLPFPREKGPAAPRGAAGPPFLPSPFSKKLTICTQLLVNPVLYVIIGTVYCCKNKKYRVRQWKERKE